MYSSLVKSPAQHKENLRSKVLDGCSKAANGHPMVAYGRSKIANEDLP